MALSVRAVLAVDVERYASSKACSLDRFWHSRFLSIPRRLPPIAERFGDMDAADRVGAGQIGDGPRYPQDSRVAARREAHRLSRLREQRSEEHTSELQSLMRNSYAVFCLTKKKYRYQTAAGAAA